MTLWVDQVSVDAAPASIVLGPALSVTIGANAETVMVADWVAEPPLPVQVSSKSVVLWSASVAQVPLVATAPLQPPEAVQAVAFSEFQLNVDVPSVATVVGVAANVTAGAGAVTTTSADCEAEPPGPVHVSV